MKNGYILLVALFAFTFCNAQWTQVGQEIFGEHSGDYTGTSVSISGNGNRAAIYDTFVDGDSRGRIRVFELQGDNWVQLGDGVMGLIGDGTSAGIVKLNASGNRFIFSSPISQVNGIEYFGSARVFEYQQSSWNQIGETLFGEIEGDLFGASVDISSDGNIIIVGAIQSSTFNDLPGYIKVFTYEDENWIQIGNQINGVANEDEFGKSVSISSDGNRIAISSPNNDGNGTASGQVRVFQFQNNTWNQVGSDIYGDEPGDSMGNTFFPGASALSLNQNGNVLAIGVMYYYEEGINVGQAKVFELQNNNWVQKGQNINGNSINGKFGATININESGDIIVVGDPFGENNTSGVVKVFKYNNNNWNQIDESIVGEEGDFLGWCTDINYAGDRIIYGAILNDDNGNDSGKVEILQNDNILGTSEVEQIHIKLYPIPAQEILNIETHQKIETVKIYSLLGQLINPSAPLRNLEDYRNRVDVSQLTSGIYFIQVTLDGKTVTKKFIKE